MGGLCYVQSEQLIEECTVHSHAIKAGQLVYLAAASIHRGKHQVAVAATREALSNASEARDGLEVFASVAFFGCNEGRKKVRSTRF